MDFMSLLDTANKNAKNVSKTLDDLKTEVDSERKAELKRIEAERIKKTEILKKKKVASSEPVQAEKKFVIPKKNKDVANDDKAKVMAYLAKKSEEERQLLLQKKAEKERLIQLRLQANGGKATKRIAKNFGLSAIDLQIRYGHDHEHVERLQKQKWKEEDRLATQYRDGVYKAIAQRKKLEEKVRGSTSKSQQAQRLSSDGTNSRSSQEQSSNHRLNSSGSLQRPKSDVPIKKVKPAPVIGFSELMKAAQDITEGKEVKLDDAPVHAVGQKRPHDPRSTPCTLSVKRSCDGTYRKRVSDKYSEDMRMSSSSNVKSVLPLNSTKKPESGHNQSTSVPAKSLSSNSIHKSLHEDLDVKKDRKDHKNRLKKGPTPPPIIPPPVPGKRYLPGDIRYKQAMEMSKQSSDSANPQRDRPGSSKVLAPQAPRMESNKSVAVEKHNRSKLCSQIERQEHRISGRNEENLKQCASNHRRERTREQEISRHYERHDQSKKSEHRRNSYPRAYNYDSFLEEGYDEEEYDSEMEDFIDDSGLDMEELSRQEFEETLKMVNPKYNKKKWREREQTISLRDMHADYRTIAREEARSARIGLIEDLNEATKGKSEAL